MKKVVDQQLLFDGEGSRGATLTSPFCPCTRPISIPSIHIFMPRNSNLSTNRNLKRL